jgi:hypothetical protein
VATRNFERRLLDLERATRVFPDDGSVVRAIDAIERIAVKDPALLARYHDALLFVCAHPASPKVLKRAESILKDFGERFDDEPWLDQSVSGIAGTYVASDFPFDVVRRLPGRLDANWEDAWPGEGLERFVPFALEQSVDANVDVYDYLRAAGGLRKLLGRVDDPVAFDAMGLVVVWSLGNSTVTRTRMRRPRRRIFFQDAPLLARRDVSIEREFAGPPLKIRKLSRREGQRHLDMAVAAMATRYRIVYSFTYGDPATVISADCGRGVEIVLNGLLPEKRLPLRAGFAPFIFRNGIPIGYADAFALGDRMDTSFNIFYAFRDGEAAFVFARLLKLYRQLFGTRTFSIDPYQIGLDNEEAIDAGAFWFYRKLGFRSTDPAIEEITLREEALIARDPRHRTPARTLRRMARSPMRYGSADWDRFDMHTLGLAVTRAGGDLYRVLPDLRDVAGARRGRSERRYVRAIARHARLRRANNRRG